MDRSDIAAIVILVLGLLALLALFGGPAMFSNWQMSQCLEHDGSWIGGNCLVPSTFREAAHG